MTSKESKLGQLEKGGCISQILLTGAPNLIQITGSRGYFLMPSPQDVQHAAQIPSCKSKYRQVKTGKYCLIVCMLGFLHFLLVWSVLLPPVVAVTCLRRYIGCRAAASGMVYLASSSARSLRATAHQNCPELLRLPVYPRNNVFLVTRYCTGFLNRSTTGSLCPSRSHPYQKVPQDHHYPCRDSLAPSSHLHSVRSLL